jgi:hypothetical protein
MRFIPVKEDPDSFFVHESMDTKLPAVQSDHFQTEANEKRGIQA